MKRRIFALFLAAVLLGTDSSVVYAAETIENNLSADEMQDIEEGQILSEEEPEQQEKEELPVDLEENAEGQGNELGSGTETISETETEIQQETDLTVEEVQEEQQEEQQNLPQEENLSQEVQTEQTDIDETKAAEEDFVYSVEENQVTITGYTGNLTELEVPKTIGGMTVIRLGSRAFENCKSLSEVTLPNTLTSSGDFLFSGCTNLKKVSFEEGTQKIYDGMLWDAAAQEFVIPSSVTEIGKNAFNNCDGITGLPEMEGVTRIGSSAFADCDNIKELNEWPENLESLGGSVFENCKGLSEVTLPNTLTSSGYFLFSGCTNLKKVSFEEGTQKIYDGMLFEAQVQEIVIPSSVTEIGGNAFKNCDGITGLPEMEGVTRIGSSAFADCDNIKELNEWPENLESLGGSVFENCKGLSEVTLPNTLTSSGYFLFSGCTNLKKVSFEEGTQKIYDGMLFEAQVQEIVIPSSVTEIGGNAFKNCDGITGLPEMEGVTRIGSSAFADCDNIKELNEWPENLESLGGSVFENCKGLSEVTLPNTLTSSGYFLFSGCTNLKKVSFEEGTQKIYDGMLFEAQVQEIVIPSSVTEIGGNAFKNCDGITGLPEMEGVTRIGSSAFADCDNIKELNEWPENLESLGGSVFENCKGLSEVTLPNTLTSSGDFLFSGCTNLKKVSFEKGTQKIYGGMLRDATSVTEIFLPDSVEEIGIYAFANCTALSSMIIPENVQLIENHAFDACSNLARVSFEGNVNKIGDIAFTANPNLIFYIPPVTGLVIYAMDHNINFSLTEDITFTSENSVMIRDGTSYVLNQGGSSVNGYLSFVLNYEIKEEKFEEISDPVIKIRIPYNSDFVEGTLTVDGKKITDFEIEEKFISVPVGKNKGVIRYSANRKENTSIDSYAAISYRNDGAEAEELLGIVHEQKGTLSMNTNSLTSDGQVKITGLGPANTHIDFSIEDMNVGSAETNKSGNYSTTLSIPQPQEGKTYKIKGHCLDQSGNEAEAYAEVRYSEGSPVLTSFQMYYGGKVYNLLEDNSKKTVVFVQASFHGEEAAAYSFDLTFENYQKIDKVYVTSTRNNVVKKIEAKWSEQRQAFVASGWFDENNKDYVLGQLNCYYTLKGEDPLEDESNASFDSIEQLPEKWQNTTVDIQENTEKTLKAVISFEDSSQLEYTYNTYTLEEAKEKYFGDSGKKARQAVSAYSEDLIADFFMDLVEEFGWTMVGEGSTMAIYGDNTSREGIMYDIDQDVFRSYAVKVVAQAVSEPYIADFIGEIPGSAISGTVFSLGYGTIQNGISWAGNMYDIDAARMAVQYNSNYSAAEKAQVLKYLDSCEETATNIFLMRMIGTVLKEAGKGMILTGNIGWGLGFYIMGGFCGDLLAKWMEYDLEQCIGMYKGTATGSYFTFLIDPSGYVYEGVTANRLEGVTATLYYKENEEGESQIWNASEYGQENPQITDAGGNYVWDVPEGLWKVTYEKEGYETAESNWLPVPPPQTDVNIGMISKEVPELKSVEMYSDHVSIVFTKYMKPDTVANILLKDAGGKTIDYTLEYDKGLVNAEGENFAAEYLLKFKNDYVADMDQSYTLTVGKQVCSYAGVPVKESSMTITPKRITELILPAEASVKLGESISVPVIIANSSGTEKLEAYSEFGEIVSVDEIGEVSREGNAEIRLTGKMSGNTKISIGISGTAISSEISVSVGEKSAVEQPETRIVLPQSAYKIKIGEKAEIIPAVYPEKEYEGTWKIEGDKGTVSVKNNIFTAKKEGTVTATYQLTEYPEIFAVCKIIIVQDISQPLPFEDVKEEAWYYEAVEYVYENNIMSGLKETVFGPDETLVRAQFAVILHRLSGAPEVKYTPKFTDVEEGQWYTDGILWANEIGVVSGYSESQYFGPNDNITREQMALMMYRYAGYKEFDISRRADIDSFIDSGNVSSYARQAMEWAAGSGIITGKAGNRLDPQGYATRAECASIIMRFIEKYF